MSFFQKVAKWIETTSIGSDVTSHSDAIQRLHEVIEALKTDEDAFYEIMQIDLQQQSEVIDLAKMLQLLNHKDDSFQEQGIQLLQSYNSPEAWEALMVGATIDFDINHSSLRMSPALKRALLQNPFYDYSANTKLKIETPFAENLKDLALLTELEELHLHFTSIESIFKTLEGLSALPKLKKIVIVFRDNFVLNPADSSWVNELQNIEEIEVVNSYYQPGTIHYGFIDSMPNLKKVSFYGVRIDYQNATFVTQPEVHIFSVYGTRTVSFEYLLPSQPSSLIVERLDIDASSVGSSGLNLGFLKNCIVKNLYLNNTTGIYGVSVLAELDYDPIIEYTAENIADDSYRSKKYYEHTWSKDTFQQFEVQSLKVLLEDKENRRSMIHKIMEGCKSSIQWSNFDNITKEYAHTALKEVIVTFPEQGAHLTPRWAARQFRIPSLANLPLTVEKIQYGQTDRETENWMGGFGRIDHLVNLKEVVVVKPISLKTSSFEYFLQFPKLEKIIIIGGKSRKRIPKALIPLIELR